MGMSMLLNGHEKVNCW